jgi:hypothetical protein
VMYGRRKRDRAGKSTTADDVVKIMNTKWGKFRADDQRSIYVMELYCPMCWRNDDGQGRYYSRKLTYSGHEAQKVQQKTCGRLIEWCAADIFGSRFICSLISSSMKTPQCTSEYVLQATIRARPQVINIELMTEHAHDMQLNFVNIFLTLHRIKSL